MGRAGAVGFSQVDFPVESSTKNLRKDQVEQVEKEVQRRRFHHSLHSSLH